MPIHWSGMSKMSGVLIKSVKFPNSDMASISTRIIKKAVKDSYTMPPLAPSYPLL